MAAFGGQPWGTLGYRGKRLAEDGQALGITVEAIARGRDGQFIPEHLIAFVAIAFISILSRRLKRLVVEELNA
jgi:hypothetical protein